MLVFYRPRHPKKMFYQRLTLPIHELENKRQLKCTFMSIDQKEEKEVTLYPNKGSRVEQMLEEAKQVINGYAISKQFLTFYQPKLKGRGSMRRGCYSTTTFNAFLFSMSLLIQVELGLGN
jgi:hypothetical protein